jgi:hypothetical protein
LFVRPVDDMLRDYSALVGDGDPLWGAVCWSVIQPGPSDPLLRQRIGTDVAWRSGVELSTVRAMSDPSGPDSAWVVRFDDSVGLLEVNGVAGSLAQNLAVWSRGWATRVASFYWNEAISRGALSAARNGQVQQYDLDDGVDDLGDVPWLAQAIEHVFAARADHQVVALGLALVEALTGVVFQRQWLTQSWPAVQFTSHPHPRFRAGRRQEYGAFVVALRRAAATRQSEAFAMLADAVVAATGLGDEPAAVAVSRRILRGEGWAPGDELSRLAGRLDEQYTLPASGKADTRDPRWRRMQGGAALLALLAGDQEGMERITGPLGFVQSALDGEWPTARDQALRILTQPGPMSDHAPE